jgi:hypothetical protein
MVAQNDYEIQAGYTTRSFERLLHFFEAAFHSDLMRQIFNENVFYAIGWAWGGHHGRWRGDRDGLIEHIEDNFDLFRVWEILFRPRHVFALEERDSILHRQIEREQDNIDTLWHGTYTLNISGSLLTNPEYLAYNVEILNGIRALIPFYNAPEITDLIVENLNQMLHKHWNFARGAGFEWIFDEDWTDIVDNTDAIAARSQIDLIQAFRVLLEAD